MVIDYSQDTYVVKNIDEVKSKCPHILGVSEDDTQEARIFDIATTVTDKIARTVDDLDDPSKYITGTLSAEYFKARAVQGITGAQGTQGITGIPGADIIGTQGAQGTQGSQGSNGPIGTQGSKGAAGNPELGPQGFTGPQGYTGLSGVPGERGIQGIQGLQGTTGSDLTLDDVKQALQKLGFKFNSDGSIGYTTDINCNGPVKASMFIQD